MTNKDYFYFHRIMLIIVEKKCAKIVLRKTLTKVFRIMFGCYKVYYKFLIVNNILPKK